MDEIEAEAAVPLPNKEVMSLLDVNANVDLGLDLAAPVDLAVAANLNVAAPIEASAAANVLSPDAQAVSLAQQHGSIDQGISGSAHATAPQNAEITQNSNSDTGTPQATGATAEPAAASGAIQGDAVTPTAGEAPHAATSDVPANPAPAAGEAATTGATDGTTGAVAGATGAVTGAVGGATGAVEGATGGTTGAVEGATGAVGGTTGAVEGATGAVGGATGAVGGAVGGATGAVDGVTGGVENLLKGGSLLNADVNIHANANLTAPIDGAVAANANVAAP